MNTARSRLGNNVFDPRADLIAPAKKVLAIHPPKVEEVSVPTLSTTNTVETSSVVSENTQSAPIDFPTTNLIEREEAAPVLKIESVLPSSAELSETKVKPKKERDAVQQPSRRLKVRFGANVPADLKERLDNAAYWVPGLTVSKLVEVAIEKEIKKLEKEYNEGKPFSEKGDFRYGRPKTTAD